MLRVLFLIILGLLLFISCQPSFGASDCVTQIRGEVLMIYEFRCSEHGVFEVDQPMMVEHKANCPECDKPTKRVYSPTPHYWDSPKPLFHKDGSYEEKY